MRAKLPDQEGFVERDGVKLHYEIYGDGPETMVFLPPWSIVHARVYKAQLPYFSERFRCIAYDGRGNGKSGRPEDVPAYSLDNYVADALAVMDANDADKAILVGLSFAGLLACILAAHYGDRVKAAILAVPRQASGRAILTRRRSISARSTNGSKAGTNTTAPTGFRTIPTLPSTSFEISFPNRTRPSRSRMVSTGRAIPPAGAGKDRGSARDPAAFDVSERCIRDRCPVLIIHGEEDRIQPYARAQLVADVIIGAELVTIPGGGHNPMGRFPAKCNALITDFLDRRLGIGAGERPGGRTRHAKNALSVLPYRPRAWTSRHRHHAGIAQIASGPAD